jgi:primosomal protein N' (replication factor Y) (superfamily II helicase)
MNILRVALDLPLPTLFDYRHDDATQADIGCRVVVPFGKRRVVGIIVDVASKSEVADHRLRRVENILRDAPPLSREWMELARFCSGYYHRPLGEVIMASLPPRLRALKPVPPAPASYDLTASGREGVTTTPARQKRLRALLERLARGAASEPELASLGQGWRGALERGVKTGWIAPAAAKKSSVRFVPTHALTQEQQRAIESVRQTLSRFAVTLLFGITGSGKTEIYLHLVAEVLDRGRQALVLVPEIALTPALEAAFRERFPGATITVQTSAMAELERTRGWLAAQSGSTDIVLGTRLAAFTPLPRLGLIVVDEEQDASFKQQEGLRYSARDVAIVRAHRADVPVLLCSATPSLETFHHAKSGKYGLVELTRRAIDRAELPRVRLVDVREHTLKEGVAVPIIEALAARLARGEQSLVFLNRRGYAPVLACPACGWVKGCPRCSAHMVLHLEEQRLRCHHCGLAESVPKACPQCGNVDLRGFGRGTQRIESTLAERFPDAGVLRMDSDSARGRGRLDELLDRAERSDILVGTQILAKGHHFERLTLVAVLNADSGLFASDYRAGERMFAQLHQVAGRAGRAGLAGEVMIQTRYPHHPMYQSLMRHDFAGFSASLLAERREAGFPPFVFEAVLRAESPEPEPAMRFLGMALERAPKNRGTISIFDPAPMSLARLAGMERAQVLLQSRSRPRLQEFLREWSSTLYELPVRGVRWHIDVDPTDF